MMELNTMPVYEIPKKPSALYRKGTRTFLQILGIFSFALAFALGFLAGYGSNADYVGPMVLGIIGAAVFGMSSVTCIILCCIATGKELDGTPGKLYEVDNIWIDLQVLTAIIVFSIWFSVLSEQIYWISSFDGFEAVKTILVVFFFSLAAGGILLTIALSMIRQIRANTRNFASINFFRRYIRKGVSFLRSIFDETRYQEFDFQKRLASRQRFYTIAIIALGVSVFVFWATVILPILAVIGIIGLTFWFVHQQDTMQQDMVHLMQQIDHISQGDLSYQPQVAVLSPLYPTSRTLLDIQTGFQKSVDEQIKSEHMKIELITNVSHDLKTPLTSIISYVDLLSKEELTPEAQDYVKILAQKSDRLKNIVADLFTLAKVTSGNEQVDMEELDMSKLVVQTLSDMDDRIQSSEMTLKSNIVAPPVPVYADGRKLYRVLQNLIDNALKYAMPGTRIFVDLVRQGNQSILTVKNTSGYEMDFTESEILERFTRGDKARTSDGSGLGLSIAQGFTEACGGRFQLTIDGDQFKVAVSFPIQEHVSKISAEEMPAQKQAQQPEKTAAPSASAVPVQPMAVPVQLQPAANPVPVYTPGVSIQPPAPTAPSAEAKPYQQNLPVQNVPQEPVLGEPTAAEPEQELPTQGGGWNYIHK